MEMVRSKGVHSERLMLMVERLLSGVDLTFGELDGIAVSSGPGSFTGLRIGMATAKGLCVASGVSLVAVSTLEALAYSAGNPHSPVCVIMSARKQEVYAAVYDGSRGAGGFDESGDFPQALLAPAPIELHELLPQLPPRVHLAGPGVRDHRQTLDEVLGDAASFAPDALNDPTAGAIALLGERHLALGHTVDPADAEPSYLKLSQVARPTS